MITPKAYQELRQEMLARVPDTYDKRDPQPIPTAISPAAYVAEGQYIDLDYVQRQAYIMSATGDSLDKLAPLGGISRYAAAAAVRLGLFNIEIPVGSRFSTINGENSIDLTATAASGMSGGQYAYQLTADTPGSIGNDYTGPILPITSIQGLTSAQITDVLVPGDDAETDEEFRERLLLALTDRPFAGNVAAYREKIMSIDGVGAVQVYPTWAGGGTVKCVILGADYMPVSYTLLNTVQTKIDPMVNQGIGLGFAPIGATVLIATPGTASIAVSAALTLQPGYNVGQLQSAIEAALEAYMLSVRQSWDTNISTTGFEYAANIYRAQIIAAIVGVTGVVNATNVRLNGADSDIILPQTGSVQQVPVLGVVTLT